MRYQTKLVEVEAFQLPEANGSIMPFVSWAEKNGCIKGVHWEGDRGHIIITTLEGNMEASPGDYIVKGLVGEFYPCKPHIFEMKYELAK